MRRTPIRGTRVRADLLKACCLGAALGCFALTGCDQFARVGVLDPERHREDAGPDISVPDDAGIDQGRPDGAEPEPDGGAPAPTVTRIVECDPGNPAGLPEQAAVAIFETEGGDAPPRLLYPYDGTVFPGGLPPPLVMWDGPAANAVVVRLRAAAFEYIGCLSPSTPGQVAIPERAWTALEASNRGSEQGVDLQLVTLRGQRRTAPATHTIQVAPAPLPLSLSYMAYDPILVSPALYRLRLGQSADRVLGELSCTGCHAASADGTTLLGYENGVGVARCVPPNPSNSQPISTLLAGGELGALTPNGALYLAPAHPLGIAGTRFYSALLLDAALVEVSSGATLPDRGIPPGAMVPSFAPDGRRLVFNDFAIDGGRGLAVMDFDPLTGSASSYREVHRDSAYYPGWPSFVRNTQRIIFARGATPDFSADGAYIISTVFEPPHSDLYSVEVDRGEAWLLARAMGFDSAGDSDEETYLPFGREDLHKNYYPHAAPVLSGGYAWIFFDSIRHYGNQGSRRQIWGAALDLTSGDEDPSHPPFYVPGQDLAKVNLRAVPAVDPMPGTTTLCPTPGE